MGSNAPGAPGSSGMTPPGTVSSLPPGTTMTTTPACATSPLAHAGTVIRRLTTWEYVNSVADVLGTARCRPRASRRRVGIGDLLPADIRANGFSNDSGGQLVSLDHTTAYQAAADAVGRAALAAVRELARAVRDLHDYGGDVP